MCCNVANTEAWTCETLVFLEMFTNPSLPQEVNVAVCKQNSEVQAAGGNKAGSVVQATCGQQTTLGEVQSSWVGLLVFN